MEAVTVAPAGASHPPESIGWAYFRVYSGAMIRALLPIQYTWRLVLILPLLAALLAACSSEPGKEDEQADWTAAQLYNEAKKALTGKSYEKAIKLYEKLEARYPFGNYATQAQVDVAYAYYKNSEPDSAIAAVDRFIKLNPTHPHVDYAYYLRGLVNYNRGIGFIDRFLPTDSSQRDPGSARDALKDFDELIAKFPHSKYADDSRLRVIALRNNLAMYEIHVADFYMRRGAYVAAARRCSEVLQKYGGTQAMPQALQIMEQAYRKLDLNDMADDAARVYALNYGPSSQGRAAVKAHELTPAEQVWDFIGLDR